MFNSLVLGNVGDGISFESILPVIIIAAIVVAILVYLFFLNNTLNNKKDNIRDMELEERRGSIKVSRVTGFMPPKYREFYMALKTAMPDKYKILPNIAIELLFQRANRRELKLEGYYASFCVFTRDFSPVLVIALNDFTEVGDRNFRISPSQKKLIMNSGIPVLEYEVRDNYSIDELRRTIAQALNPLFVND